MANFQGYLYSAFSEVLANDLRKKVKFYLLRLKITPNDS